MQYNSFYLINLIRSSITQQNKAGTKRFRQSGAITDSSHNTGVSSSYMKQKQELEAQASRDSKSDDSSKWLVR